MTVKKISQEVIVYARSSLEAFAKRGFKEKMAWLNLFVRSTSIKISDGKIWANYVRMNVREGRESWSCSYCKCNPNSSADHTIDDETHRFKPKTKHAKYAKYAVCPEFVAGDAFRKQIVGELRAKETYFVPV